MPSRSRASARPVLVALLALAALVLLGGSASAQSTGAAEEQLVRRINQDRTAAGLAPLAGDAALQGVARSWTPRMAGADRLSHNAALGDQVTGSWTRLAENVGVARASSGEQAEATVERLHRAFMDSAGHRANVLGDFDQVGVGAVWQQGNLWITVNFSKGRADFGAPIDEAVGISQQLFAGAGAAGRKAEYVVVGRAEVFADALGGSGLAGDRAPILFTNGPTASAANPPLHGSVAAEIDRVLGGRGRVYLLGGTGAVSARVEQGLKAAGYDVRRLSGASRVETSVKVAQEIVRLTGKAPARIIVARADDWADAVTGGAYAASTRSPLVLTYRDDLHPSTRGFLDANRGARRFVLGGSAAVSDGVVKAAGAERIAGPDRTATAVAVAERLWGRTAGKAGDRFALSPGYNGNAWAYALAMAPWSAVHSAPQLLVYNDLPASVSDYLTRLGYSSGVKADLLAASPVTLDVRSRVSKLLRP